MVQGTQVLTHHRLRCEPRGTVHTPLGAQYTAGARELCPVGCGQGCGAVCSMARPFQEYVSVCVVPFFD